MSTCSSACWPGTTGTSVKPADELRRKSDWRKRRLALVSAAAITGAFHADLSRAGRGL